MACVIDLARYLSKKDPKRKGFLANWFSIFGKWNMFVSLHGQYVQMDCVPAAATLQTEDENDEKDEEE